ncbi:hypothetical protein M2444_003598 [Paenibacillus sp. PastF-3]|uniref:hypothetical protein n=1 Tax=unclassified Paenibacillus TaxID=185978 RepID=UPI002474AB7A|nr:hypothetical protein [Paenibacillus sp. PastF-3]MDH6371799.1 hypothetical protein [Paenibacillus sp. PastF-3]
MMISHADMYRPYEGSNTHPYAVPFYDTYFHDHEEGVVWSNSYLSAIVVVIAYYHPQTEVDFSKIELTTEQMRVVELAKEIRRRRNLLDRHHNFCIDVPLHHYKMEMQKMKEHLAFLDEIEPRVKVNLKESLCPGCEGLLKSGEKNLHLPNGNVCCNYDCYSIILAKEHDHGH